jgi:adenine-specific DNA-methyltransferase
MLAFPFFLSGMAELIWDGKYDEHGNKRAPVRIELPFQTVETINESAQERQRTLELSSSGNDPEWRNRLIWGDKKYVLPSLLPEFAGKVDLIYIDPPFDTGADFSFSTIIPGTEEEFTKQPSVLEQKAYRDTWGRGMDSYLAWLYETVTILRELLSETGSVYVHLDWHVGHYAKAVLDEVFPGGFKNEIVWHYLRWPAKSPMFQRSHDTLFWYGKSDTHIWHQQYQELSEATLKRFGGKKVRGETTKVVLEADSLGAPMRDVWEVAHVLGANPERLGFPTQKPEALLERVLTASSNERSLILDCFCGSGTTAGVAEKLNRRWIACDLGRFAIHTTRKRLLGIPGVKPFVVQNLGKYERQQWQVAEFPSNGKDRLEEQREREGAYRKFILELYHATPVSGHVWLHGMKAGRMVHVAAVDAPVTRADVNAIAAEVWKAAGKGPNSPLKPAVDVLGWEFALEINETAKEIAAQARVDAAFKKIPREVLERKAVEQGDVYFFELGALSVDSKVKKRELTLTLSDFVIPSDDVPAEVRGAIKHWSQMVDYWAVDWDFKDDTFHNQWQSYRTRKSPKLELSVKHEYSEPEKYTAVVKVIDILGNDTTKMLTIDVK